MCAISDSACVYKKITYNIAIGKQYFSKEMITSVFKRIFGNRNDRFIDSIRPIVEHINILESQFAKMSNEDIAAKSDVFRDKLLSGISLDEILPEAFATVREASKRVLNMRHFDVQIIGGIVMHQGKIAEMRTGEGKTLVATLPAYLNALSGKGVHVVTTNDYLAMRDSEWMGGLYNFLGLTVGCVTSDVSDEQKLKEYACDITYGTNNDFGFDYLKDNLKYDAKKMVQRPFNYAIIDEVDSILIDEARTPLIISGNPYDSSQLYFAIDKIILKLSDADYILDEKSKDVILSDQGHDNLEVVLKKYNIIQSDKDLYDISNMSVIHHVQQALKAHKLFKRDVDYMIKDNKIMIIDEFTGRVMEGRRYSDGLHQAIEAKEKVEVQNENNTIASITFQNYFRMYPKLSGMTGTAMTEAKEFASIYNLSVVSIPPNIKPMRVDFDDEIYLTSENKYSAMIKEIKAAHAIGQPILIGTTSIEKSEIISRLLKIEKIKHQVLNAKYHDQEASIIAQAGRLKAVTIATNMAGRGTDIKLGGNLEMLISSGSKKNVDKIVKEYELEKEQVISSGGLYVIGTERHESRRIDNQLRGRSGRQGDPGKTKFYISMQDDLMKMFGSDKITGLLSKLGLNEGEAIIHPWVSKSIAKAQHKVEMRNYDIRKSLLKFDDVMNQQRKVVYEQRLYIIKSDNLIDLAADYVEQVISGFVSFAIPPDAMLDEVDLKDFCQSLNYCIGSNFNENDIISQGSNENIENYLINYAKTRLSSQQSTHGEGVFEEALRYIMIMTIDSLWQGHLSALEHLRCGIGLRAYGQKDPLNEYKLEAFGMFKSFLHSYEETVVHRIMNVKIDGSIANAENKMAQNHNIDNIVTSKPYLRERTKYVESHLRDPKNPETWGKVLRNELCPCGSLKKYKHCHGAI